MSVQITHIQELVLFMVTVYHNTFCKLHLFLIDVSTQHKNFSNTALAIHPIIAGIVTLSVMAPPWSRGGDHY